MNSRGKIAKTTLLLYKELIKNFEVTYKNFNTLFLQF